MPTPTSAQDILTLELKEIYSAERLLSRALPKLSKRAHSATLREMLDQRREQGAELIEELDDVFEEMDAGKSRPKNVAAEGLLKDAQAHVEEIEDDKLLDPVLLASVQKLEHYCIAAWGTAAAMGRLLGQEQVVKTMEKVLQNGKQFDEDMTRLAEEEINPAMLETGGEEEEDEREMPRRARRASARGPGRPRRSH